MFLTQLGLRASQQQHEFDNTKWYQARFLDRPTTNLYNTSYRPTAADIWCEMDTITGANLGSGDVVASISNDGTGSDLE